jgi:ABC-type sulfate transport system permease component
VNEETPSRLLWARVIAFCALILILTPLSLANLVLAFAMMVRAFGLHTVWDEIFAWSTDELFEITLYTTAASLALTYIAQALHGWIHRERMRHDRVYTSDKRERQ